ncbi:hypothetical protein DLJ49_07980 [Rhodovulum sp. 12E13]|nr:hypothetical protein DLJ49_07980 [Rhodovulum sp. 12E13]
MGCARDLPFAGRLLPIVTALSGALIRGAHRPRRPPFRARTEPENGVWALSRWRAGRRAAEDGGGAQSFGRSADGGGGD